MVRGVTGGDAMPERIGEAGAAGHSALGKRENAAHAVAARVAEALKTSGYAALQNVVSECREGVLVLRGSVPSFYMKQMAQTVASKVPGVEALENLLSVGDAASDL
jgi:osmotically-inducible protein OsmY